jgi:ferritin
VLEAIDKPPAKFSSPQNIFEETVKHEKKVTALINNLYDLSEKADDKASKVFLQWFITEQVEEEKERASILEKLKMIKPGSASLLMLDRALAQRE